MTITTELPHNLFQAAPQPCGIPVKSMYKKGSVNHENPTLVHEGFVVIFQVCHGIVQAEMFSNQTLDQAFPLYQPH